MNNKIAALLLLPFFLGGDSVFFYDIEIAGNGKSEYVIVRPAECGFEVVAAASKLSRAVKKETGAEIKIITDTDDRYSSTAGSKARKPHEIIIGDVLQFRENVFKASDELLYRDYSVRVYENDIVISAGSDAAYSEAIQYITEQFLADGEFNIRSNFSYVHRADYEIDSLELCGSDISEYAIVYSHDIAKEYAESFASELLQKTGVVIEVKAADEAAGASGGRKQIVFGVDGEQKARSEYKISLEDSGNICISSATGNGLKAAYDRFKKEIFESESGAEKIVKIDSLNIKENLEKTDRYSDFIVARTPLSNTRAKLENDKKFTVAYFGGSVTVGFSSSDRERFSWRALTTKWLRDLYPEAEITEINAAIGASGTNLGAFRTERDIISQKPDLLFVEFAVNDSYNGDGASVSAKNYEAIVRRVRRALPECDIVNIYITDSSKAAAGGDYLQAQAQDKVAEAYGISSLNVGKAIIKEHSLRGNQSANWSEFFADIVHMTDKGFAVYADVIAEYLADELIFAEGRAAITEHQMPEVINPESESELLLIAPHEKMLENSVGYTYSDGVFNSLPKTPYNGYLVTNSDDNSLTFSFKGSELSLYLSDFTSGIISYTVDGKSGSVSRNSMNNPFTLVSGLADGEHEITFKIKFSDKSGTAKIGGFLVR